MSSAAGPPPKKQKTPEPPARAAALKDVDTWLDNQCRPASFTKWLVPCLTPEYAFVNLLDAVFGRGPRFSSWLKDPPDFGDDFHWSEIRGAGDLVMEEVEWDDIQYGDPWLGSAEEQADEIIRERYEAAEGKMGRLRSAKQKTNIRKRALDLLTAWLETEPATSQTRRQDAQKAAMLLFEQARQIMAEWFDKKHGSGQSSTKEGVLRKLVTSSCPDEDGPYRQLILDELYVFLITYELYVDLRLCIGEPQDPEELTLPLWTSIDVRNDDCWWPNQGQWNVADTVPWRGRGLLAKVTLLHNAIVVNLASANNPSKGSYMSKYASHSWGYSDLWKAATEHLGDHPLALEASLIPIEALTEFLNVENDYEYGFLQSTILGTILPKLKSFVDASSEGTKSDDEAERIRKLIQIAKGIKTTEGNQELNRVRRVLKKAANQPALKSPPDPATCLRKCINNLEMFLDDEDAEMCTEVTRLRLTGNHSKEYLLRAAIRCPSVKLLDLENCANLDETILDAMADACSKLRFVLLKGTGVSENSEVVKKLQKRKCTVDFSGERCRCSGFKEYSSSLGTS